MNYKYLHNKELTNFSRNNRKQQTDAEKLLWHHLRNKQLLDFKFRRQYPIGRYILDFYCLENKLAVELDGSQHLTSKKYDKQRDTTLQSYGIEVLRFWDNDVLKNIDGVLELILKKLLSSKS